MVDFYKAPAEKRQKLNPAEAPGEGLSMRFNQVVIAGRLVADPELKYAPNGTPVCKMRVAFDQGGGDNKKSGFINVTCFQKVAENAAKYLKKGSRVLVGGRIDYQEWENDGQKRNKVEIAAHDLQFLDPASGEAKQGTPDTNPANDPGW